MEGELASWLAVPEGHLSLEGSRTAILVLAAVPLAFALLAVVSWLRFTLRRRALRAEAARAPAPGSALVTGVVEVEGEGPAVRMEIEQEGGERYHRQRRRTEQRWREVARRVIARPFHLRLPSGGALRVEPDRHALVVANEVPGVTPIAAKRRLRVLELGAGETLTVRGAIEGEPIAGEGAGYRDAARGEAQELVLRPSPSQPMMIVVGPAGQQAARRARAHLGGLVLMLLGLGLSQLVNVSYHLRRSAGEDSVGTVLRFEQRKSFGSKSRTPTTYVWVAIPRKGFSRPVELDFAIGGMLGQSGEKGVKLRPGMRVPVRFVPSSPWASELGVGATLWAGRLLPGFLILLLPVIGYGALAARARREPATLSRLEETTPDGGDDDDHEV